MGKRAGELSRRELLGHLATVLGVASVSPAVIAASAVDVKTATTGKPSFLSFNQLNLVETVAEMIMPATDTPGASAAGVHYVIDALLDSVFSRDHQQRFVAGLAGIDTAAQEQGFDDFVSAGQENQLKLLQAMDQNPEDNNHAMFQELKELTLLGYYTSEIGATQELAYQPIPGAYNGCVPYEDLGRAWLVW